MKKSLLILTRYLVLLVLMFSLPLIYKVFTPLTINAVAGLLRLFIGNIIIINNVISINLDTFVQIIPACVAGSAYLLLLILNLTIEMDIKKRILSILLSFALLFILNTLRIFILIILYQDNFMFFNITHKLLWYVLSTVFVVLIWFLTAKIFSIKKIPVYSDFIYLFSKTRKNDH